MWKERFHVAVILTSMTCQLTCDHFHFLPYRESGPTILNPGYDYFAKQNNHSAEENNR
jgi:hypothetical protein